MSQRYLEIYQELIKKKKPSGKNLLSLIRELCFYIEIAPNEEWIFPLLQVIKSVSDNDTDRKILRISVYLITSSLLSDKWSEKDKQAIVTKESIIKEMISIVRGDMDASTGSRYCYLWSVLGTLAAASNHHSSTTTHPSTLSSTLPSTLTPIPTSEHFNSCVTHIASSLIRLQYPATGTTAKNIENELQVWGAELSALRRMGRHTCVCVIMHMCGCVYVCICICVYATVCLVVTLVLVCMLFVSPAALIIFLYLILHILYSLICLYFDIDIFDLNNRY